MDGHLEGTRDALAFLEGLCSSSTKNELLLALDCHMVASGAVSFKLARRSGVNAPAFAWIRAQAAGAAAPTDHRTAASRSAIGTADRAFKNARWSCMAISEIAETWRRGLTFDPGAGHGGDFENLAKIVEPRRA